MRQIFSSPRIENVQRLEALLVDAGIETRITGINHWKRQKTREFSYSDRSGKQVWPTLWVVRAEDYARARQLLRDEGLDPDATRASGFRSSYLPGATGSMTAGPAPVRSGKLATRIRLTLIAICVVVGFATTLRHLGVG